MLEITAKLSSDYTLKNRSDALDNVYTDVNYVSQKRKD